MKNNELDWHYTEPPTQRLMRNEKDRYKLTFYPRTFPYNVFVQTDGEVHKIKETEYLIGYHNEISAIGVAKDVEDIGGLPLTMQFGTREEQVGREIYVGCTLIVKSYVRKVDSAKQVLEKFVDRNATFSDMFFNDRLFANTLAVEWAIVHKPKLVRSLGYVLEFEAKKRKDNRVHFTGEVCDQESNLRVKVIDDQWPSYIREAVKVESAVVITWIDIDEPHTVCKNFIVNGTLLPSGSSKKLNLRYAEEVDEGKYWLGWVDTTFKASRNASTMAEEIKWRTTKTADPNEDVRPLRLLFHPRILPLNFFVNTDTQVTEMTPIEYLIGYCNGLTAIGVAKDLENLKGEPLTMQFGTRSDQVGLEIYLGCTVTVKSYVRMICGVRPELKYFPRKDPEYKELFFNDRLSARTQATEWIISHKPKRERALGYVLECTAIPVEKQRFKLHGLVMDQENNMKVDVIDDKWAHYIKKNVKAETAVVITWIRMDEPHSYCKTHDGERTLLPANARKFLTRLDNVFDANEGDYWLAAVDTKFV